MKITKTVSYVLLLAFIFSSVVLATPVQAATKCDFTRNLDLGVDGEDVRCLQKYLNGAGFIIAGSGVGSPGNETSLYRDKTKAAVAKWQAANGVSPATGFFGTVSRQKFAALSGTSTTTTPGPSNSAMPVNSMSQFDSLKAQVISLTAQLAAAKKNSNSSVSGDAGDAKNAIKDAMDMIEDAKDEMEDADNDGDDTTEAKDDLDDADEDLMDAANMLEHEKIQVVNVNNGERIETYLIKGERGSGIICLNGPAARKAVVGDIVIIISYALMDFEVAKTFKPTVVFPNAANRLV